MPEQKISIIIPVINEGEILGSTLQQLKKNQAGYVGEILVVDGGSRDNTVQIAADSGAKVLHSEKKSRAAQMNLGARMAKEEILFFLHADTIPPEGFDRDIIIAVNRGADFGSFPMRFDWEHPLLGFYGKFTHLKSGFLKFGDQSLFVKRRLFEKVCGFDESLFVMEDQKIVRELMKAGEYRLMNKEVVTSARKYRENGVLKLQTIFVFIYIGYYLGCSQEVLIHFYRSAIDL